jgi:hypothetical protein
MDPDADPDPAIFVIDLPKMPTKTNFLKVFFAFYFMKVSKFVLLFLLSDRRIQIRIRIQEAQKHVDPVNPDPSTDPQHCGAVLQIHDILVWIRIRIH